MIGTSTPPTIARFGLLLGPLAYLVMVGYVIATRVAYPFELEWMEGGSLQHLFRLQAGLPIYAAPSLEFTAYQYPPFYYYLALLVAKLPGVGWFLPLRLASLAASLGCVTLIVLIIRKHTASLYWGLVGGGLFVATFRAGGAWFDVARVDMVFVFLLLAAHGVLVFFHTREIWSGVLLALAFYSKQTALLVAVPLVAGVAWRRGPRAGIRIASSFLLIAGGTFALEEWRSGGWYGYYVFGLPGQHGLVKPFLEELAYRSARLLEPLPVAVVLGLAHAVLRPRQAWKDDTAVTGVFLLGLVGLSIVARLSYGCYDNVSIPAFAALSIVFGLGGHWFERRFATMVARVGILAACAAQFVLLNFDVRAQIPTPADRAAGQAMVEKLRSVPGDVLIPSHNYLARAAGKAVFAHEVALMEVQGGFSDRVFVPNADLEASLRREVANGRFGAVIMDSKHPMWQPVYEAYQSEPLVYLHERDFMPVTGLPTRPRTLWTPP